MNDPLVVTLLAVAVAALGAWLWVQRRRVREVAARLLPSRTGPPPPSPQPGDAPAWSTIDKRLFFLSLGVFAVTRLIAIEDFPIYFFTDEAANTVLAAEFVQNGFKDASGRLFPVYFSNTETLSLGVSVYAQVIPFLLFGASIAATRATSALIALSGAAAAGLILKDVFRTRLAWVGVLLLAITPAWFLHSRTAFETTLYVSMFAWFLYFYLCYRAGHRRAIFPAVLFGALAFYSYNTGQAGIVLCALLLGLVDARYHWENRRMAVLGAALAIALTLPYVRFQAEHPGEIVRRFQLLDSYIVRTDLNPAEKAARFVKEYAAGLSPLYWYAPENSRDLIRHRMKGYGNILWPTLPFAVIGLVICFRHGRDPAHRAVLIAALTAPVGAAMAGMHVTRALVFVVPAALLTLLGAASMLRWVGDRLGYARMAAALFVLLSLFNGGMLWDGLANGPTWYSDYGLTGMQYGVRQVFSQVSAYLADHPRSQAWVFPTAWNGSDMLRRFFAPDDPRVLLLNLDSFLGERFDAIEEAVAVLTQDDYERVIGSGKFTDVDVEGTVPLPDGTIGFYLVRLSYSREADAIFAAEREARRRMVEERVDLSGRTATARHTPFDIGSIHDLFDGDQATMARTAGINPAVIELDFSEPVWLTGLTLTTGSMDLGVTILVFAGEGTIPGIYDEAFIGLPPDPTLDLVLEPPPGPVRRLTIEIRDLNGLATSHVHLREVALREE
jgi:hypothetical protein